MKYLGKLKIENQEDYILLKALKQNSCDFTESIEAPLRYLEFLKANGYKAANGLSSLLYSGGGNVAFHEDPFGYTAMWVLAAPLCNREENNPFFISDKSIEIFSGDVIVFDSTKRHAVLANSGQIYILLCLDVIKIRKKKLI